MATRKPLSAEKTNILITWAGINLLLPFAVWHWFLRYSFDTLGHTPYYIIIFALNGLMLVKAKHYKWLFVLFIFLNLIAHLNRLPTLFFGLGHLDFIIMYTVQEVRELLSNPCYLYGGECYLDQPPRYLNDQFIPSNEGVTDSY